MGGWDRGWRRQRLLGHGRGSSPVGVGMGGMRGPGHQGWPTFGLMGGCCHLQPNWLKQKMYTLRRQTTEPDRPDLVWLF